MSRPLKIVTTETGSMLVPPPLFPRIKPSTLAGALVTRLTDIVIVVPLTRGGQWWAGRSNSQFTRRGYCKAA